MNKISLSLTAGQVKKSQIKGTTTVVIDVLRATTVIITAIGNGAKWVLPVSNIDEAKKRKLEFPDAILGGERDAVKISGFENGNSPLEYTSIKVRSRGIILTTTNGTKALSKAMEADQVIIASMINMSAIVSFLSNSTNPIHIICSGTKGEFSMDDFLCAGGIISKLNSISAINMDDLCLLAKNTWSSGKNDVQKYLSTCKHYKVLENNGFSKDLSFCLVTDTHPIVPKLNIKTGFIQ